MRALAYLDTPCVVADRVNHHEQNTEATNPCLLFSGYQVILQVELFFTSTWLSAIIRRISPREKQRAVFCEILNIAGAILTHVLHIAACLPIHLPSKCPRL